MADLIDRLALLRDIEKHHLSHGKFQHWVEVQPSVDAVEVVRCKYCVHLDEVDEHELWCKGNGYPYRLVAPDGFCSHAERRSL